MATPLGASRRPCALPTPESTKSFWHSQPNALLTAHRTTRELPKYADVVIVGSGITGTSVANHLLNANPNGPAKNVDRQEPSVVMLEAREACWGATGRNGGHCQPIFYEHPHDPSIARFELANFHTLLRLITEQSIDCEFVQQPGVRAIYSRHHLTEVELALLTLRETAPELAKMVRIVTSEAELRQLRIPTAVGAAITEVAARMWPYKFVSQILTALLTANDLRGDFNLQTLTPVTSVSASSQAHSGDYAWIVTTPRGSIASKKVVLATNGYTSHLLEPTFANLIVPVRGQMTALLPPRSLQSDMRLKNSYGLLGEGLDDYLIQRPNENGGHLMFGGGRQAGAQTVGVTNDNEIDEKTSMYLRGKLVEALDLPESAKAKGMAMLEATHQWTGIMAFSRDDLPWVGPIPEIRPEAGEVTHGRFLAAGYTGHGMPNAWLCGKAVASMVEDTLSTYSGSSDIAYREAAAVQAAIESIGLPKAYVITQARIKAALALEDVGSRDWAEMERSRAKSRLDRPPSGYA